MINLIEQINKYVNDGYNEIYANAKVAQDIILSYLFKSEYKNNITIKGGVVMYNLTNDKRRATIDIDLDLIRIYLADDNLYKIFTSHKLRGIDIIVDTFGITDLKHQDYKGKRIPIIIRDTFNNEINTNAQLIATLHDISLLDCKKLFRKEQIWFTNKDENGTELYSLKEFSYAENGVRDTSDIKEKYSKGEFGAIPDPDLISVLLEVDMNEDN